MAKPDANRTPGTEDAKSQQSTAPSDEPVTPRTEPARTPVVNTSEGNVRAGPGDAGAAETPQESTEPVPGRKDSWSRVFGIIGAIVVIGLLLMFLF